MGTPYALVNVMGRPPAHAKSIVELSGLVGVTEQTLRAHANEGCPMPKTARQLTAWVKKYHEWRKQAHGAWHERLRSSGSKDEETRSIERELTKLRTAEVKLRVGEKTRQLINRNEVVVQAGRSVQTVRARLNAMVMKMVSLLENVPGHVVEEELQTEVDAICNAFALGMTQTFGGIADDADCPFCHLSKGE